MTTEEILSKAIELRKPISYEYNKIGKIPGERIGNVYALYRSHTKPGIININADIVQTSGVSDSINKQPLPSFRTITIDYLSNVRILEEKPQHKADNPNYNPSSERYNDVINKI